MSQGFDGRRSAQNSMRATHVSRLPQL